MMNIMLLKCSNVQEEALNIAYFQEEELRRQIDEGGPKVLLGSLQPIQGCFPGLHPSTELICWRKHFKL